MTLSTVDEFGFFLGVTFTDAQAERAQLLLELASGAIQRFTRQTIELVEDDVAVLHGTWKAGLVLPQVPVVSVSTVELDIEGVLTEDTDWSFDGQRTLWRGVVPTGTAGRSWGGDTQKITVTYTHGWEEIPAEIRAVCLQIAARSYRNPGGVSAESVGQYSVTYGSGAQGISLTPDEKAMLRSLRSKWVSAL